MAANRLKHLAFGASFALANVATASNWRFGASLGYGGAGVQKQHNLAKKGEDADIVTVERAVGPGTFSIFADYLITSYLSGSLEHARGFSLGPFASGVTFTGIAARYYFSPAQSASSAGGSGTVMRVKRYVLFAGGGAGVATGTVTLEGDKVPKIDSSGIYVSGRVGAEYLIAPRFGIRPEVVYGTTLMSSGTYPGKVSQFSIQVGIYYFL